VSQRWVLAAFLLYHGLWWVYNGPEMGFGSFSSLPGLWWVYHGPEMGFGSFFFLIMGSGGLRIRDGFIMGLGGLNKGIEWV